MHRRSPHTREETFQSRQKRSSFAGPATQSETSEICSLVWVTALQSVQENAFFATPRRRQVGLAPQAGAKNLSLLHLGLKCFRLILWPIRNTAWRNEHTDRRFPGRQSNMAWIPLYFQDQKGGGRSNLGKPMLEALIDLAPTELGCITASNLHLRVKPKLT